MIESIKNYITKLPGGSWVLDRLTERTSLDGGVLVIAGVVYLVVEPIGTIVAYGSIAYGLWTIWKKEK